MSRSIVLKFSLIPILFAVLSNIALGLPAGPAATPGSLIFSRLLCVSKKNELQTFRTGQLNDEKIQLIKSDLVNFSTMEILDTYLLSSNGWTAEALITYKDKTKFYVIKSEFNFFGGSTVTSNLHTLPALRSSIQPQLDKLNVQSHYFDFSPSQQWYVIPNQNLTGYDLVDLSTKTFLRQFSLLLEDSAIAGFSKNGEWIAFYTKINSRIRILLVNGHTGDRRWLPKSLNHQIQPVVDENVVYYVDKGDIGFQINSFDLKTLQLKKIYSSKNSLSSKLEITQNSNKTFINFIESGDLVIVPVKSNAKEEIRRFGLPSPYRARPQSWFNIASASWADELYIFSASTNSILSSSTIDHDWQQFSFTNPELNGCANPSITPEVYIQ